MNSEEVRLQREINFLSNLIGNHKTNQPRGCHSVRHDNKPNVGNFAANKYKLHNANVYRNRTNPYKKAKGDTPHELKKQIAHLQAVINNHKSKNAQNSRSAASQYKFNSKNKNSASSSSSVAPSLNKKVSPTGKDIPRNALLNHSHGKRSNTNNKHQDNSVRFKWKNENSVATLPNLKKSTPKKNTVMHNKLSEKRILKNKSFICIRKPYSFKRVHRNVLINSRLTSKKLKPFTQSVTSSQKISKFSAQTSKRLSSKVVQIGGIWYKSSNLKLLKASIPQKKVAVVKKNVERKSGQSNSKVITVRGVKFSLDNSRKQLIRINTPENTRKSIAISRVDIGGVTFIQTKPGLLRKSYSSYSHHIISRAKNRSIHHVNRAKLKETSKKNRYCMFYNRFGKCNKGTECKFIHDADKIAVCTRFVKGKCKIKNCPFSHKISKNKMPVCSYFLRGRCNLDNCPYLHVNVNPNAKQCKDFLSGFCPRGAKCKKLHSLLCPAHLKTGKCPDGSSCQMKHKKKSFSEKKSALCVEKSSQSEATDIETIAPTFIALAGNLPIAESKRCLPDEEVLKVLPSFLDSVSKT